MNRFQIQLASVCLGLALVQCGRATEFLYAKHDKTPDTFTQHTRVKEVHGVGKLDVLWVVDNSGSMGAHQRRVVENTGRLYVLFYKTPRFGLENGAYIDGKRRSPVSRV